MLIDWVEGTILRHDLENVLGVLKRMFFFLPWEELDRGWNGYSHAAKLGRWVRVCWNPDRRDMGVHLRFSSQALGELGHSVEALVFDLEGLGFRCSRLDVAADDYEGRLDMDTIARAVEGECVSTHSRRAVETRALRGGSGRTIAFGSRQSETYVRIYDKAAEQLEKHKGVFTYWVRVELELKGKRAAAAFKHIVMNLDGWRAAAAGWILAALDFKEKGRDQDKSRWGHASWWTDFLETVQKVRLFIPQVVRSVSSIEAWVRHQVLPSLYVLEHFMGVGGFMQMVMEGGKRLTAEQLELISSISPAWGLR